MKSINQKYILTINFLITLNYGIFEPFFPVYIYNMNISSFYLGFILCVYSIAKIVFSPTISNFVDIFSKKKILYLCFIIHILVPLSYLFSPNALQICLIRVFQAVAIVLQKPALLSFINEDLNNDKMCRIGIYDFMFYIAIGIGPLLGGWLKNTTGYNGIFLFMLINCVVCAMIVIFKVDSTDLLKKNYMVKDRVFITQRLLSIVIYIFGRACVISGCYAFLPIYIENVLKLDSIKTGAIMSLSSIAMGICLLPFSKLGCLVNKEVLVTISGLMSSLQICLLSYSENINEIFFLFVLSYVFGAIAQPMCTFLLLDEGEKYGIGKAYGYFNLSMNSGFAIGPLFGSLIINYYNISRIFLILGIIGVFTTLAFFIINLKRIYFYKKVYIK